MDSKVVRADFGSGMICHGAQTCMDSKVVRADFDSGLICPRAQTCCAELRRLARLANSPGFKSFRCPRWRIKFSLERFHIRHASVCVPSRWKVLSGEFRRRPTVLAKKSSKPDRVGRRGLSEPREDFSRLTTYVFLWLKFCRDSVCVPSRWKVLSGEFRRRPTAFVKKFSKPDRVGRRGLSESREDFSRLTTYAIPWLDSVARFQPLHTIKLNLAFNKSTHG